MKKLGLILLIFTFSLTSFGQSTNDLGKIALSVVMPENVEDLEVTQLSKLETKISQIVTVSGLASSGYNNNFVIYPKFAIYESNVVEGGMQNIIVVTAELSLYIKQVDNNVLFATISKPLKGSGSTKKMAITNAFSQINTNDVEFKNFIETGKLRIIAYYESRCDDIVKKSESFMKMKQYDQALGLLMSVPEEVSSCYHQIQNKAVEVYKTYQTQKCFELIQKAKTSLSKNYYNLALDILSEVDPSTSCFTEAQTIAKLAETKVKAEEKKQWDFRMKVYNDSLALQNKRIAAIKEIAVAYYKSKPTSVSYTYLIR